MIEARKAGVKVATLLNSNFVVVRFGAEFRKEDLWKTPPKFVFSVVEPLKCMLDNIESGRLNKINVGLMEPRGVPESVRA